MIVLYPSEFPKRPKPIPVFPAVPSTTVPPLAINFFSWASLIKARAALSFTDPPGFKNSAFPKLLQPVFSDAALNFINGVFPFPEIKSFC